MRAKPACLSLNYGSASRRVASRIAERYKSVNFHGRGEFSHVRVPLDQHVRVAQGRYVAATPLAAVVAKANDDARAALITEVGAALKSSVDHQGLAFAIEAHLALVCPEMHTP